MASSTRLPANPGFYPDMLFADYLLLDAMSRSDLLALMRSPAYFKWRRENPQPETDAMRMGTAIHTAILEPNRYGLEYAVGPDVKLSTKVGKAAWAAFEAEHPNCIHLRAKEGAQVRAIADSVRSSEVARRLLSEGGSTEATVVWEDAETGVLCKARLDREYQAATTHVVLDLKSTRDAAPRAFRNQIARAKYDLQLAMYGDGAREALGVESETQAVIVAYEKPVVELGEGAEMLAAPPACSVHVISPSALDIGRAEYRELLRFYLECEERGAWPDFSGALFTYEAPTWRETWSREERWT